MHIPELYPNISTKCIKMSEEQHKRHGMNGTADGSNKEEGPKNHYAQGGRLKFFKDGKFILELERAREGERVSWVSVPRKTFWPPQGTGAFTPSYRQESSTSMSVSDDNSSIQSSPWQRDHSWKQTTPRRNQSKEMTFYFWRSKQKCLKNRSKKCRRPYSILIEELIVSCSNSESSNKDSVCNNNNVNNNTKKTTTTTHRRSLLTIIQNLIDKKSVSYCTTPPRSETVVSPRKRFLREMEKDNKIQIDDNCQKRSRNKTQQLFNNNNNNNSNNVLIKNNNQLRINGTTPTIPITTIPTTITTTTTLKTSLISNINDESNVQTVVTNKQTPSRNCSYSITSLLAEDRNVKRSPSNSPSHYNSVTQTQYNSLSSDDRWYSESVDRLRSIELSQADKRAYPPYHPHHSFLPPYMYPYPLPPYYNVYGRGYMVPPLYHAPPVQIPTRNDTPSCSWTAEPIRDTEHKDDITDMPLNLSKHAG